MLPPDFYRVTDFSVQLIKDNTSGVYQQAQWVTGFYIGLSTGMRVREEVNQELIWKVESRFRERSSLNQVNLIA